MVLTSIQIKKIPCLSTITFLPLPDRKTKVSCYDEKYTAELTLETECEKQFTIDGKALKMIDSICPIAEGKVTLVVNDKVAKCHSGKRRYNAKLIEEATPLLNMNAEEELTMFKCNSGIIKKAAKFTADSKAKDLILQGVCVGDVAVASTNRFLMYVYGKLAQNTIQIVLPTDILKVVSNFDEISTNGRIAYITDDNGITWCTPLLAGKYPNLTQLESKPFAKTDFSFTKYIDELGLAIQSLDEIKIDDKGQMKGAVDITVEPSGKLTFEITDQYQYSEETDLSYTFAIRIFAKFIPPLSQCPEAYLAKGILKAVTSNGETFFVTLMNRD